MKKVLNLFLVPFLLFFSFLLFAEVNAGNSDDLGDTNDTGETGDTGDIGDSEPADSATDTGVPGNDEPVECENEAGHCTITVPSWEYVCICKKIDGIGEGRGSASGPYNNPEEVCEKELKSNCGTKLPTVRDKCGDEATESCIEYVSLRSNCTTGSSYIDHYMTEDEIRSDIDSEELWSSAQLAVYSECCKSSMMQESAKIAFQCLKEKCGEDFTDECCAECNAEAAAVFDGEVVEPGDTDSYVGDTGDAEIPADTGDSEPTDGTTESGDTENSEAPADSAAAPTENKESKSDGCSLLFI